MKKIRGLSAFVVGLLVALCVTAMRPQDKASQGSGADLLKDRAWLEVSRFEIPQALSNPTPGTGAMGTSCAGFDIGSIHGTYLVDRLARPALAVFVGWNPPAEVANEATDGLRVVFYELDGTRHVTKMAAGGGNGYLFHSPDGVEVSRLSYLTLLRDADAQWVSQ